MLHEQDWQADDRLDNHIWMLRTMAMVTAMDGNKTFSYIGYRGTPDPQRGGAFMKLVRK